jgi:hypothetical protein
VQSNDVATTTKHAVHSNETTASNKCKICISKPQEKPDLVQSNDVAKTIKLAVHSNETMASNKCIICISKPQENADLVQSNNVATTTKHAVLQRDHSLPTNLSFVSANHKRTPTLCKATM